MPKNASSHTFNKNTVKGFSGFTLTELMIASAIGSIVVVLAAQSLIAHLRLSARSEAMMRAQDIWSRIYHLIDQDIQEASCIAVNTSTKVLTLTMSSCEMTNPSKVTYSLSNGSLQRVGPPVSPTDGTLDLSAAAITAQVAGNISEFSPSLNTAGNLSVNYSLNIEDPSGFSFQNAKTTATHVRSRIID